MSRPRQKTAGPSQRGLRVGALVRHAAADILARGEIEDPDLGRQPVTICAVRMSPDLRLATLAVAPLGGKDGDRTIAALERCKKALRAAITRRVNLKFAPELRFVVDTSFETGARIDALLKSPEVARDLGSAERGED